MTDKNDEKKSPSPKDNEISPKNLAGNDDNHSEKIHSTIEQMKNEMNNTRKLTDDFITLVKNLVDFCTTK